MKHTFLSLAYICLLFMPVLANADTDYTCLKACVGSGGNSMSCMPKCSFGTQSITQGTSASMSYACLKNCMDTNVSKSCVPDCTTVTKLPSEENSSHPAADSPIFHHDVFKAPVVSNDVILPSSGHDVHTISATDYQCVKLCTQSGMDYRLCSERCTKQQ